MKKYKAFTLIELLVVIAIISLLVAILLPSLQKAKEHARTVICSVNDKTIGIGMAMFLNENNGKYPQENNIIAWNTPSDRFPRWWPQIGQYVGDDWGTWDGSTWPRKVPNPYAGMETVGHCPNHLLPNPGGYTYRANCYIVTHPTGPALSEEEVNQTSEKVLTYECFADTWIPVASIWFGGWGRFSDYGVGSIGRYDEYLNTHGNVSNFLMVDLHVETTPLINMINNQRQWYPAP